MAVYLDCNATTPTEPEVQEAMADFSRKEFGNAGSRTHEYGSRAKQAAQMARRQVADVVGAKPEDVVFTSGATESNNLALVGLARHGLKTGRCHIVTTEIEHSAVLGPLAQLREFGFEVTTVPVGSGGSVDPNAVIEAVRPDTLAVSVMQANNETGIIQPIGEIAGALANEEVFFHVDAAQGFGKRFEDLTHPRIDLISASAHKLYGPKGIGALILRRRGFARAPVGPLMSGGGQERGIRPGTLPVPLAVGFGLACEIARRDWPHREATNLAFRKRLMESLDQFSPRVNGDPERSLPHTVNLAFPGVDSEALIVALKDLIAVSNGSACTSVAYEPSHVLKAMRLPDDSVNGAIRVSWCHLTEEPDWDEVVRKLHYLSQ